MTTLGFIALAMFSTLDGHVHLPHTQMGPRPDQKWIIRHYQVIDDDDDWEIDPTEA